MPSKQTQENNLYLDVLLDAPPSYNSLPVLGGGASSENPHQRVFIVSGHSEPVITARTDTNTRAQTVQ